MSRAECFMDAFHIMALIWNWAFVHKKHLPQIRKLLKMFLNSRKWFPKTSERKPYKPTLKTKRTVAQKKSFKTWKNVTMCISNCLKQIIKQAKITSQFFGEPVRTLVKRYYQTTNVWFGKLERTKLKKLIV